MQDAPQDFNLFDKTYIPSLSPVFSMRRFPSSLAPISRFLHRGRGLKQKNPVLLRKCLSRSLHRGRGLKLCCRWRKYHGEDVAPCIGGVD